MGNYLNPDNIDFRRALNSEIYVDKSELIKQTNAILDTENRFVCVSRPRRFGKSMAANMLTAYYSKGCDSSEMFAPLKISSDDSFEKYLNKYNVIHINMVEFSTNNTISDMIAEIEKTLLFDILDEFSDLRFFDETKLIRTIQDVFTKTKVPFIFIIDEWDCVFRIKKYTPDDQTEYLNFLRNLLKDKSYVALAYMTGILPIKKYGEHSRSEEHSV